MDMCGGSDEFEFYRDKDYYKSMKSEPNIYSFVGWEKDCINNLELDRDKFGEFVLNIRLEHLPLNAFLGEKYVTKRQIED